MDGSGNWVTDVLFFLVLLLVCVCMLTAIAFAIQSALGGAW